jgi:LysR family hydrogen peroxide-inducible transcriptional activator
VGVTLLPVLAVKPPVANADNMSLVEFRGRAPSRRIAMVWRRSSALAPFLKRLAQVFRELPPGLLDPHALAPAPEKQAPRPQRRTARRRASAGRGGARA